MTTRWTQALIDCPTTGCSALTARQDGVPPGVAGSHAMAETDLPRVLKLTDRFKFVADETGCPSALLAAIASRESRCGAALDGRGYGDHGHAYGIMQIDIRYHHPVTMYGPSSPAHVRQAESILEDYLERLLSDPTKAKWTDSALLRGAVCAYNSGLANLRTIERLDVGTTGNDYSADVIARAQYYLDHPELRALW